MSQKRKSVFSGPSEDSLRRTKPKARRSGRAQPGNESHGSIPAVTSSFSVQTETEKTPCLKVDDNIYPPSLPPILDTALEKAVFTHPAITNDLDATYDRLEILGDAYIELMATKFIWNKYRDINSGHISQIRELLVKNETLAEYASMYEFDRKASVPQEYLTQPKRWMKTKGDIFEAYVAAAILSDPITGYQKAEKWLTQLWLPKLSGLAVQQPVMNAKENLARKIMGKDIKLKYIDEREPIQPEKGKQTFFIGVYLTGWGWSNKHLGSGQGPSKAVAGNEAAQRALQNTPLIDEIVRIKRTKESNKSCLS